MLFTIAVDVIVADVVTRFDIEGHVSTLGHPEWARTHEAASSTSPVVSALVEGGATCVGTTVVDDLAYGFVPFSILFPVISLCIDQNC